MHTVLISSVSGVYTSSHCPDNGPKAKVDFDCRAEYDPYLQNYAIIGNWSLSDPLAAEVVPSFNLNINFYQTATSHRQNIRGLDAVRATKVS